MAAGMVGGVLVAQTEDRLNVEPSGSGGPVVAIARATRSAPVTEKEIRDLG